ncbi:MAG: peroxiredoxin [Pseudomonadota bacterium]|nr:MAG: peroxiredoxin [Pseudomonadota bacterium]
MFSGLAHGADPMLGALAPEFALIDQKGNTQRVADYRGKWVVLYFYPKDDTPGCTTEACQFRDDIYQLHALGAQVLGVSIDNQESHKAFAEKHGLPFPLLADTDGKVAKSYGALWSFGFVRFARRHTFIIDTQGKVVKVYRSVSPSSHSDDVIAALRELQAATGEDTRTATES